jgi:hypothetical protein
MATLSYGKGICSISGTNVKGVQINYEGSIEIDDKTPEGYEIFANHKKILIFALNSQITLGDLFEYEGYMKIHSIIVSDQYGNKIPSGIKKAMHHSEYIESNSEDMTLLSEEMGSGYNYGRKIKKTRLKHRIIKNQHTSNFDGVLYLDDGSEYTGYFHIHKGGKTMTGGDHDEGSKELFIRRKDQKNLTSSDVVNRPPQTTRTNRSGGY